MNETVESAENILTRYRQPVLEAMRAALDRPAIEHVRLMRYHLGWEDAAGNATRATGGKMLRPVLCLLSCEAAGGDVARGVRGAAAIELLHNFTLIHDDIEDASDMRHGRETLWRRVGVPLAINAGDGMFVLAQRTLLSSVDAGVPADVVLACAALLNAACTELCEGQHADISFETQQRVTLDEYARMVAGKTAALLGVAAQIGALLGGADGRTSAGLGAAVREMGMAFQVWDDVLGIWGDAAVTGKPVADDIRSKKRSYPVAWALERAPDAARSQLEARYAAEMTAERVGEVVTLLEESGARAAAGEEAERRLNAGLAALAALPLDGARRDEIAALATSFVRREA